MGGTSRGVWDWVGQERGYPAPTRRAAGGRNKEFNTGEHPSLPLPASRQTFKSGLRYYNKEGLRRNNAKHLGLISDKTCCLQAGLGGKKEQFEFIPNVTVFRFPVVFSC